MNSPAAAIACTLASTAPSSVCAGAAEPAQRVFGGEVGGVVAAVGGLGDGAALQQALQGPADARAVPARGARARTCTWVGARAVCRRSGSARAGWAWGRTEGDQAEEERRETRGAHRADATHAPAQGCRARCSSRGWRWGHAPGTHLPTPQLRPAGSATGAQRRPVVRALASSSPSSSSRRSVVLVVSSQRRPPRRQSSSASSSPPAW